MASTTTSPDLARLSCRIDVRLLVIFRGSKGAKRVYERARLRARRKKEGDRWRPRESEGEQGRARESEGERGRTRENEGERGRTRESEGERGRARESEGERGRARESEGERGRARKSEESEEDRGELDTGCSLLTEVKTTSNVKVLALCTLFTHEDIYYGSKGKN
jgi:hypothetical protein